MTKITRVTVRETAVMYRGDPLVIEIEPKYIRMRRKGKTGAVNIPYDAVYELGLKLAARRAS